MKRILYVAIAFMGIMGASFADGLAKNMGALTPMTIERSQFYKIREKNDGNHTEIKTEVNFALYHNDSKNLAHWVEIRRTMSSKNAINENDFRPLGLREIVINGQRIVMSDSNTKITKKVEKKRVVEVIRIEIPQDLFDKLGNQSTYQFVIKADNFPEKQFVLSKHEAAQFANGVEKIKHSRSDRS